MVGLFNWGGGSGAGITSSDLEKQVRDPLRTRIDTAEKDLGTKISSTEKNLGNKIDTVSDDAKTKIDGVLEARFGSTAVDLNARLGSVDGAVGAVKATTSVIPEIKTTLTETKAGVDSLPKQITEAQNAILDVLKGRDKTLAKRLGRLTLGMGIGVAGVLAADYLSNGALDGNFVPTGAIWNQLGAQLNGLRTNISEWIAPDNTVTSGNVAPTALDSLAGGGVTPQATPEVIPPSTSNKGFN